MVALFARALLWIPLAILGGLLLHSLLPSRPPSSLAQSLARALALPEPRLSPSGDPAQVRSSLPPGSLRHDPRLPTRLPDQRSLLIAEPEP